MATMVGGGNALFPVSRNGFLVGTFDWDSDVWYTCFVDNSVDAQGGPQDDDEYLDDITAGARIKSATVLSNEIANPIATDGDGIADGDNVTQASVNNGGAAVESLLVVRDATDDSQATPADDEMVVFIEDANGTLPVTPNGGDITITWDAGANKIFKL